jgi:hypothetical protein
MFTLIVGLLIAPSAQAGEKKHETIPGKTQVIHVDSKIMTFDVQCILKQALLDKELWVLDKKENATAPQGILLELTSFVIENNDLKWKTSNNRHGDPIHLVYIDKESLSFQSPASAKVAFRLYGSHQPFLGVSFSVNSQYSLTTAISFTDKKLKHCRQTED